MSRALGLAISLRYQDRPFAPFPPAAHPALRRSDDRPAAPLRWARKLRRAVPASLAVFRRQVETPVHAVTADVGTKVVSASGSYVGSVEEILVGMREGGTTVAVSATNLPRNWVLLVPERSLRSGSDAVVLADRLDAVAVPRELTSAA
jgi:sporulation protein YlmC with PRC-barrel domain